MNNITESVSLLRLKVLKFLLPNVEQINNFQMTQPRRNGLKPSGATCVIEHRLLQVVAFLCSKIGEATEMQVSSVVLITGHDGHKCVR